MVNDLNGPENTSESSDKPNFQTPEEIAAQDSTSNLIPGETVNSSSSGDDPRPITDRDTKQKSQHRFSWEKLTKKQKIIAVVVAIVILLIAGGVTWKLTHYKPPTKTQSVMIPAKPVSTTVASTLTGLQVNPSVNQREVTGVMIENSIPARPQSGLNQAGVVFEAVAEAGITRFLALYQDTQPTYLGPVRSARPYYVQWCLGFDCALAHVGGSPEALTDITAWNVQDLNQYYNSGAYERISTREAPHNVYTSAAQLNVLEAKKSFTRSIFTGFPRKADQPDKTPNASSIDISPSSVAYSSHYDYDATGNDYKRSEAGAPHMEVDQTGAQAQIIPKVVIAMVMTQGIEADDYHTTYDVIGSGQAFVFQDGTVTTGTWQKTSNTSQISFTTTAGKTIKLNAGQTWLVAVGNASDVTYK
ncbi:MAG TPA: DUF3048 domain-containing protein [Candidatus Saccharimonadales bacterium]|nr:DUF3048 domain-containing protein [Candidatus Saccharimonadales bacterium]